LGNHKDVGALVSKAVGAWEGTLGESTTLVTRLEFGIARFIMPRAPGVDKWILGRYKKRALILHGPPGWGKSEFACAVMMVVVGDKGFHFITKLDRLKTIRFESGQGLVFDELSLAGRDIDDVKCLLDLPKTRDIACRNNDAIIPAGTPRIFTTNHAGKHFWPMEAYHPDHMKAVKRRHDWATATGDLRRDPPAAEAADSEPLAP